MEGDFVLVDVLGNVVLSIPLSKYSEDQQVRLPASLSSGIYFYSVQRGGEIRASGKVLVSGGR